MSRAERLARNEAVFRRVNERVDAVGEQLDLDEELYVCECDRSDCTERIRMSRGDYERIRGEPRRFLVRPRHEDPTVERVVEERPEFVVVEKLGPAGELAEATDPR
jgi:hypothetical protein